MCGVGCICVRVCIYVYLCVLYVYLFLCVYALCVYWKKKPLFVQIKYNGRICADLKLFELKKKENSSAYYE